MTEYAPGTPSWVELSAPDTDAAAAFYGGLFGWTFEDVMPGGSPVPYFTARLPGGDVAAISGQMPDAPRQPAAWNTYVWVDDADATAAKARELGGEVITGPLDAPWTRMAVIRDPQGATFVASQFVLENKDLVA